MHLVTFHTVSEFLPITMGLMTIQAIWLETVFVVAEGAVNFGVGTRCIVDFLYNILVTGVTCGLQVPFKRNVEGLVGIGMATQAVFQAIMWFSFMAVVTLRDHGSFFNTWGMNTGVALQARQFRFMFCASLLDLCDKCLVTFDTVAVLEFDFAKCFCRLDADSQTCKDETKHGGHGE